MEFILRDRTDAGKRLAEALEDYADDPDGIVLALPRGGVPVGYEIAETLHLPLDVFLVRKLGVPGQEELAMGAIAMGGVCVFNDRIVRGLNISQQAIDFVTSREQAELERRNLLYREGRPVPDLANKTVLLVDDGIATGATMRAAVEAILQVKPRQLIVAVPVAPPEIYDMFQSLADKIVCLETPASFFAIGNWYQNFSQTSDDEVRKLLGEANA